MSKFIIVQVSKKRWAVAESELGDNDLFFKLITKPISSKWECSEVCQEIMVLDPKEYSSLTNKYLFDTHEEL